MSESLFKGLYTELWSISSLDHRVDRWKRKRWVMKARDLGVCREVTRGRGKSSGVQLTKRWEGKGRGGVESRKKYKN